MLSDGTLYWDGLESFRCVMKGLPVPQNSSTRTIHVNYNNTVEPRFARRGHLIVGSTIEVQCAPDYKFALDNPTWDEPSHDSLIIQFGDAYQPPMWIPSLARCERMFCFLQLNCCTSSITSLLHIAHETYSNKMVI